MDIIDTRGLKCPLPLLKLEKYLANVQSGFVVRLSADDPIAKVDIVLFCEQNNYACEVLKQEEAFTFVIKG